MTDPDPPPPPEDPPPEERTPWDAHHFKNWDPAECTNCHAVVTGLRIKRAGWTCPMDDCESTTFYEVVLPAGGAKPQHERTDF